MSEFNLLIFIYHKHFDSTAANMSKFECNLVQLIVTTTAHIEVKFQKCSGYFCCNYWEKVSIIFHFLL